MSTILCITILAYLIMGKDIKNLLEEAKSIDWRQKTSSLIDSIRPYALKAGRVVARPLLQFYYVLDDDKTSTLDRVLIYAAIVYTISPVSLLPKAVYKLIGVLDEGAALMYVYKKVKDNITPAINAKVDHTLNDWFGVEYEMIKEEK
ncbi:MAG: DUF1232 domain-containing protein [Alistipes sp.]|nr:DUF1232 domain-containing protein [Rikenellaceae bacterium]MBQ3233435.1 DUF1232 domain-containing protein [Alistipes sp.]MBR2436248.1 DUF1232 domain-containing protein [Alistipes sp.]MBR3590243.1 DUF1232 domain-containing protein [Alistipes sp.]MBR3892899.1 DUF1232 domain-containing protein [Alistipes sp.]